MQDLMGALFRTGEDFPIEGTHGLWYAFSNTERGIRTNRNTNHSWLRLVGIKVIEKDGVLFDPAVEPIFLRTSNSGEPPQCVSHLAHPHASSSGCILNRNSFVWLNVNRHMEPNIRNHERTEKLDRHPHFCAEKDPLFIRSFIYWLEELGAKIDYSGSGI